MKQKVVVLALLFGAVVAGGFALWKLVYIPSRHPNVIVIMIDTLRADHLPFYGYSRMTAPYMADLTKRSAILNAWSPTSWTKPAVASILTGMHPVRHQTYGRSDVLSPDTKPLAEVLSEHGYQTIGFTANIWTSKSFGFDRGFDKFTEVGTEMTGPKGGAVGAEVNAKIFPQLEDTNCPCFIFVHYVDPHMPYHPARAWDGSALSSADAKGLTPDDLHPNDALSRPPALLQKAIDLYDGEIRQTDDSVAALLTKLGNKGLTDNAIVVITSDHGEEFEEHRRMGHGQSLYEEVTRVPLLISGPGIKPGQRDGRASLLDIYPTILDLTGTVGGAADGVSLRNTLIDGAAIAPREFLTHLDFQDSPPEAKGLRSTYAALAYTQGASKLILSKSPFAKQLFDLGSDHFEHQDLCGRQPQTTLRLASLLSEAYNRLSRRRAKHVNVALADETKRAAAALGYLSGAGANERRSIPLAIRPADADPDGDLGWSNANACVDPSDTGEESQLLRGWYLAEHGGRWMSGSASVTLPLGDSSFNRLLIAGYNGRPDQFELTVTVDDRVLAKQHIGAGPFSVDATLPRERHSSIVKLTTSSTFQPSEHGGGDARQLGVLITRMCVQ